MAGRIRGAMERIQGTMNRSLRIRIASVMGIPIYIHPLLLVMLVLSSLSGETEMVVSLGFSLAFHELCHALAARSVRVPVESVDLTPFGGVARIDSLWRTRPVQRIWIALSGPLGSLILAMAAAALCEWGLISPLWTAQLVGANLMLMLFNLLPALPLDGGRVLCALLSVWMPARTALWVGVWAGRGLSAILAALAIRGFFVYGQLHITWLSVSAYILAMTMKETEDALENALGGMLLRKEELIEEGGLPVHIIAVPQNATICQAARLFRSRHVHLVAVMDPHMRLMGVADEGEVLKQLMEDGERPISQCIHRANPFQPCGKQMSMLL